MTAPENDKIKEGFQLRNFINNFQQSNVLFVIRSLNIVLQFAVILFGHTLIGKVFKLFHKEILIIRV